MKNIKSFSGGMPWLVAMGLTGLVAACGGGGGGQDPILGAGDISPVNAPTVTVVSPLPNSTGVAINTRVLTASFSKPMDVASLTASSFSVACAAQPNITGGVVTPLAQNKTFRLTLPATNLPANATCIATVTTAAKDNTGLALANDFKWVFYTSAVEDITNPSVTYTINDNGASDVPINTRVGATFSEALDPLTVSNATFTLKRTSTGAAVTGATSYSGFDAVFIPLVNLLPNTQYTATIKGGATGIEDLANNGMSADYSWTWTTAAEADSTPPLVQTTNPTASASNVCTNKTINASFNEAMDPLTLNNATFTLKVTTGTSIAGLVTYDAKTRIASFNPTANLSTGNYTATLIAGVNGVKDLSGNSLTVNKVWTFDVTAGTCVSAPTLGTASSFGSFGGNSTLTNDGLNTVINGNIGVNSDSTKITGLRDKGGNVYTVTGDNDGMVNGLIYTTTAPPGSVAGVAVTQARIDTLAAFNAISPANMPGGVNVSNPAECSSCGGVGKGTDELAGRTLPPGVYLSDTGKYAIGGTTDKAANLTLDAGGDANAVWVFQTAADTGTLTVGVTGPATPAVPIKVVLVNGAQAKNVFWYVPAGATIGTGSEMVGTLLADKSITFSTTGGSPPTAVKTTLNGRALALTAGVTMTNTVINVPQ